MKILFYTDMHFGGDFRILDEDGVGLHGVYALHVLETIQDYAQSHNIDHIINGGDSVNFDRDTETI